MAKPTGFLEYKRQGPQERDPAARVGDWLELYVHQPEETLRAQGARCMDCGVPFCHTGQMLNGMTSGCPINNLIPEWNDLVWRGLWREAYERLAKTNNFPEFTGRVCPAPCEGACVLGINEPPVAIKSIENAIIDRAFEEGWVQPNRPEQRTGKRVAIVGSGPAGLACADQLNRAGHHVTVYERADRIGGLMMYGIPAMKIGKDVVQRRIDLMAAAGVQFVTGCEVGRDVTSADLRARFHAVVLCTGATQARDLDAPGRDLAGIHLAMDYLTASTRRVLGESHAPAITAAGKDVIVIGGGDTGTDCVGTALRQGCRSVTQFEIMPQPPLERSADNPWPEWPRVLLLDYGQKEAQALTGADPRRYCTLTRAFSGDEHGRVTALHTVDVAWVADPAAGRPRLEPIAGSEREWSADLVLLAMGFLGPETELLQQLGVAQTERSNVAAEFGRYSTNLPGVFAAGDARRGQSLVVWAIREGRESAEAVDRYLMAQPRPY
jgi:glutamate synthase (NADPH/NADH) small chain